MIDEIWRRKNLIWELVLKDLKVRYCRPFFGFLWIFFSPFFTVIVFYLVFSLILKVNTGSTPFFLYLMSAVFPWRFFQDALSRSTTSLVDNRNLVKESSLPHYLIPLSVVLADFINFLPSLIILIITSLVILKGLPMAIFLLPLVLIIHLMATTGIAIFLSIYYVKSRDLKYVVDIALTLLLYLTPAFYSLSVVKGTFPAMLFKAYILNPFVGFLGLYRSTVLIGFYPVIRDEMGLVFLIAAPVIFAAGAILLAALSYRKNRKNINDYLSY